MGRLDGMIVLKNFSLFTDLTSEELQHVHDLAIERQFSKGDYVFMVGQEREATGERRFG